MHKIDSNSQARLQVVMAEVVRTIESLMYSGLTSVSPSITDKFQNAFEQAVKCQQLRLGSNLRLVNQELKRFFEDDSSFSEKRFSLFLNRCWQMSRRILEGEGLEEPDATQNVEVDELKVAIQGVVKKTAPGVFCALEFRLRQLGASEVNNKPLIWSCVLATPDNAKITPETLLTLDQPQGFKPEIFLDTVVTLRNIGLSEDEISIRIKLDGDSKVVEDNMPVTLADDLGSWSLDQVAGSLQAWQPTPLDLDTQPQFELYIDSWTVSEELVHPSLSNKILFPIITNNKQLFIAIDDNDDGQGQLQYFRDLVKNKSVIENNLLFGLLHFEQGIGLFQPLTLWQAGQPPKHLMVTEDRSDYAALLKILK